MPKVSVIVPNYNHAPYLRQRLDSIFNQSFQDFEVIILDDCSTDNSKEIIEEYRNRPQVSHVVYNETNSGSPFKQWAKGFDLAQGEYIWIAESDDWAEEIFLNELICALRKDTKAVIAFCQTKYSSANSQRLAKFLSSSCSIDGKDFFNKHMLLYNSICNASSAIFKKSILCQISNFYQTFKGAGDYAFWIEVLHTGRVAYVHKPLNYFRQHPHNTTTKNRTSGNESFELYKIFVHLCKKKLISPFMQMAIRLHYLSTIKEAYKYGDLQKKDYITLIDLWGKNCIFRLSLAIIVPCGKIVWGLKTRILHTPLKYWKK